MFVRDMFLDHHSLAQTSSTAISGCQVGQVCLWDLQTGTCLFSIEAHPGSCVSSIVQTQNYFISSATDNKILIWDKYSGTLVHSLTQVRSSPEETLECYRKG